MLETQASRKSRVNLDDYDYLEDIRSRIAIASFTETDVLVLEEILYYPLEFPIDSLLQNLSLSAEDILPTLEKLQAVVLIQRNLSTITVNKEKRRYFEVQAERFEENFLPGMDFLQNLLKQVPIDVLPNWYHVPRHSNNIFQSLIEKYLLTPQTFQRHFTDFCGENPLLGQIAHDVFHAPLLEITAADIRAKYSLSQETFEHHILLLEFHFICCLHYKKMGTTWEAVVTPFQEWKNYLYFLHSSLPSEQVEDFVIPFRLSPYGFADDLTTLLMHIDSDPQRFVLQNDRWMAAKDFAVEIVQAFPHQHPCKNLSSFDLYFEQLFDKALVLGLIKKNGPHLILTEEGYAWTELSIEERSMAIFKHPFHRFCQFNQVKNLHSDRNIHEIENSLYRLANTGWILLEDFIKSTTIALKEEEKVCLKKEGRRWHYSLPKYTEEEQKYIELSILDYLFAGGILQLGMIGKDACFRLTTLGRSLFDS